MKLLGFSTLLFALLFSALAAPGRLRPNEGKLQELPNFDISATFPLGATHSPLIESAPAKRSKRACEDSEDVVYFLPGVELFEDDFSEL
ncbi:hypothetical protein L596_020274 [Steinernema carpocapsae]|uniref:Uncharacterized protein n=1 Tax=Steinernema carpocapsae TaxID=34508 RepID=A0A4U5MT90_STECR|nr:hypothetical protein L596_020274 [Steinernema carpocapsae]